MIKVYLVLYNLFQFVGYTYILCALGVRYAKLEYDSVNDTYEHVGSAMKILQFTQYLDALHPLLGFTRGEALTPFVQVFGRVLVMVIIEAEPRMHTKPVVFYLFIVWSTIELVRYLFYLSQLVKKEIGILTWMRYTLWILLYPLGLMCETVVVLSNILYFEETQKFTYSLPNNWNFAFHMPIFLKVYLLMLAAAALFLMKHMYKLRTVKLKPKIVIEKCK